MPPTSSASTPSPSLRPPQTNPSPPLPLQSFWTKQPSQRGHRKAPDHPSENQSMGSWEEYVGVLGRLPDQPSLSLLLRHDPLQFSRLVNREPLEFRQSWRGDLGIWSCVRRTWWSKSGREGSWSI